MDSKRHFLISLALGVAIVVLTNAPYPDLAVVVYAAILGVAIDFDHFLASRLHSGDWTAARRVLADPKIVFVDQMSIFQGDDLWAHQRLLSHAIIIGLFVPGVYFVAGPYLAVVSAIVLYGHVLADLVQDNRNHEAFLRKAVEVVEEEGWEAESPARTR